MPATLCTQGNASQPEDPVPCHLPRSMARAGIQHWEQLPLHNQHLLQEEQLQKGKKGVVGSIVIVLWVNQKKKKKEKILTNNRSSKLRFLPKHRALILHSKLTTP